MKKFMLTTACTLVLSLLGAFGLNQNSINSSNLNNANANTTQVVKNVTDKENSQSLTSDNQITAAAVAAKATNTDTGVNTPQAAVSDAVSYNETSSSVIPQVLAATTGTTARTKNRQTFVYKKINLSNCKSINDVISTLRKNGCSNVTKSNITKIQSLNDIVAAIRGNASTGNGTATVAPTKAPSATTAPAPTKTPASTTVKPSTTTLNTSSNSSYASEVLRLVNIERAKAGLSAYTTNQTIAAAANKRAQETAVSFSHTRPNGSSFSTVLKEYGISYMAAGENIAYGQRTPQEVVTGWMNSAGHRANILNANFHKIGIGVYQKNGVFYWTQEFTN